MSSSLTQDEKPFYFHSVVSNLGGPTSDVVKREKHASWKILKRLLIDGFVDPIS